MLGLTGLRDVNAYTKEKTSIEPLAVFDEHTAVVGVRARFFVETHFAHVE